MTDVVEAALRITEVQAGTDPAWRCAVQQAGQSTLAHAPEWCAVIRDAYRHEPLYLMAHDDEGRVAVLPSFIVRRPLFGTAVTSMPFLDTGGPCGTSDALNSIVVGHLIARARRAGANVVELRCTQRLPIAAQPEEHKVNLSLPLPADADHLWRALDRSVRSQVRKAERSGLSVEFGGPEHLPSFYEPFVARMRDLGSPVHAPGFLQAVIRSFGGEARVALVRKGNATVGGLIAIPFKDRLAVPWATCLKEYFPLCPNMLLYWETIRWACGQGFRRFDFGRSTKGSGTYQFKRQWGAQDEPLFWYTIPLRGDRDPFSTPGGSRRRLLAGAWRRLPLSLTRRLGPSLRRYLTQ